MRPPPLRRVLPVAFVLGLVLGLVGRLLAGCADDARPPAPDAAAPSCAELPGCEAALCDRAGACVCYLPAGPVECHR